MSDPRATGWRTGPGRLIFSDADNRALDVSVRCLRVGGKVTGAMGFEGLEEPEATAGAVTALAAALQERSRAFRRSSQAAAAAQIKFTAPPFSTRWLTSLRPRSPQS